MQVVKRVVVVLVPWDSKNKMPMFTLRGMSII